MAIISKTQAAEDQKMRETLNDKYKKQVNELLHWDISVIDWEIIITKWWWSNNRLVFHTEDELQTYLNGVIGWQLADQWLEYQVDLKSIITDCDYYIREIKQTPEYFHDGRDDELVDYFSNLKKVLSKYVN